MSWTALSNTHCGGSGHVLVRFQNCNQPAHRCDIDHTIRYVTIKNATRSDNLGILCRRHHRLKDQPGTHWSLRQDTDGRFLWTTPAGNTFGVRPDPPVQPDLDASLGSDPEADAEPPLEAEPEPDADESPPPY